MENDLSRTRRRVLAAGGAVAGGLLAGCSSGGDGDGDYEGTVVDVGPGGSNVFEPDSLSIETGETVTFVWRSGGHNVKVTSAPSDSGWEGVEDLQSKGHEHTHTFEVAGDYEYVCVPHRPAGMTGDITVSEPE